MNTFRRQVLLELFRVFDIVVTIIAFTGAMAVMSLPISLPSFEKLIALRISIGNIIIFGAVVATWHLIFSLLHFYDSRRWSSIQKELVDLAKGTAFCTFVLFILNICHPISIIDGKFLFYFSAILFVMLSASRIVLRLTLKQLRIRGRNLRNVVIIGTNRNALAFGAMIKNKPELGYVLKGFIDAPSSALPSEVQVVSDLDHFKEYIRDNIVDEVIVCPPIQNYYEQLPMVLNAAAEQGILIRIKVEYFKPKNSSPRIEYLNNDMVLTFTTGQMRRRWRLFKMAFDPIMASVFLVVASPIMFLAAIAIKLTSPGPIFFIQERIGFNKRRFKLLKFRTMVQDAEKKITELEHLNEASGPAFKIKKDPRITPVGRILRKFSIDELPQLLNVLKGDMSLVGPRPLPLRDFKGFSIDSHRRRFCVKPGLTCLWQINGRNHGSFENWMEDDLKYIDHWSPMLDMKILLKTVPAVFSGRGAS